MSKTRKGPEIQMQDVLLACGELNRRERAAVLWTIRRHNEIVGRILAFHATHAPDCPPPPAPCNCKLSELQDKYIEFLEAASE